MIPDAPILSNVMWRRCIGDILKRPRVCGARPDRTLYCYASACVTQQESAMRPGLPSAVFKLFGASYRPCASRTEISKCILKDIFAFPAPRYAGGIRSGEECVLVGGRGGGNNAAERVILWDTGQGLRMNGIICWGCYEHSYDSVQQVYSRNSKGMIVKLNSYIKL